MSLPNVVSSQITKSQRWDKLYRIIHHLFLRNEFIHKDDYLTMVKQMNARITTVEANANASITAAVAAIDIAIKGHTHTSPPAPVNPVVTGPGIVATPSKVPAPPAAPVVTPDNINMYNEDLRLMGLGPAAAPLSGGIAPDQSRADSTIVLDIGF